MIEYATAKMLAEMYPVFPYRRITNILSRMKKDARYSGSFVSGYSRKMIVRVSAFRKYLEEEDGWKKE